MARVGPQRHRKKNNNLVIQVLQKKITNSKGNKILSTAGCLEIQVVRVFLKVLYITLA